MFDPLAGAHVQALGGEGVTVVDGDLDVLARVVVGEERDVDLLAGAGGGGRGRAIEILNPLLYPEVLLDSEGEVVQAHRMLGVAYLFENQTDEARREFRKLLELRPDYRFDPLLDPQRVVDFFNGIVKEEEGAIAAIEARRRQRDAELAARRQREAARLYPQAAPAVVYERRSYMVNFFPFGAGQFQNGERGKGMFFLGSEAALGAISLGAFATNLALYGLQPQRKCLTTPDRSAAW